MVNDKNHLYTTQDLAKDKKVVDRTLTQQQFSRFSVADNNAIQQSSADQPSPALQIQTKPQVGDPINDTIGNIGLITQIIFLDVFGSNYSTMEITDDVTFAFNKIPQGRHILFTIDWKINSVTTPIITLDSRVINPPALPTMTNGLRVVLHFEGIVDDVDTRFIYIGGTVDTGGGGVSFPIDFPELDGGNVSGTVTVNFSESTRHARKYTMTGNITFSFTNAPANETAYTNIIVVQDATGGRTVTLPAGTINKSTVENGILLGVNQETGLVIKFSFGTFYAFLETGNTVSGGGGGGGMNTNLSNMIDPTIPPVALKMNNQDILQVKNIDMDDVNSTIQGVKKIQFFDDFPNKTITTTADSVDFNTVALDQFSFFANSVEMVRIEEVAAGVYRLDLLDHTIRNAQDIRFEDTSGAVVFAGTDPAIGYDSVASRLIINMPTGGNLFVTNNNVIGTTQINNNSLAANIVNANDVLQLGVDVTVPSVVGEFRNDGTDVFVFSGGAVRDMSAIGVAAGGANVFLSNLTSPTSINQNLIPQAGKLLGSSGNEWSSVHTNNLRLGTAGVISATSIQIFGDANGMTFNIPSGSADNYDFQAGGVSKVTINDAGTITAPIMIINTVLTFNDAVSFSGSNGQIYREGSDVKVFSGGAERNMSDIGSGNQTPILQDIDFDGFDIKDISNVEFRTTTGAPVAGTDAIWVTSNDMIFNVATGKEFSHRIQGIDKLVLGTTFATFSTAVVITGNLNVNGDVTLGNLSNDNLFPLGTFKSNLILDNAINLALGIGTGTRIGTSTSQKLGFWNTTPVVQPTVVSDTLANLYTALRASGVIG